MHHRSTFRECCLLSACAATFLVVGCSAPPPRTAPITAAHDQPRPSREHVPPPKPPPPPPAPVRSGGGERTFREDRRPASVAPGEGAAAAPSAYPLNDAISSWQTHLKNGAIDYSVPSPMTTQQATKVTVNVHGFADTTHPVAPTVTGHDTLQVSDSMEVKLSYDHTEFNVDAQGDPAIKFIPEAGMATWIWYVTPINKDPAAQLTVQVYLIYNGPNGNIENPIEEKSYPVTVNVQKLTTTLDRSFWQNPLGFIEYMSPGGKGATAIVALCSFFGLGTWLKRKFGAKDGGAPKA
jgi:hypothetical protein